jgi:hypothetical protein
MLLISLVGVGDAMMDVENNQAVRARPKARLYMTVGRSARVEARK